MNGRTLAEHMQIARDLEDAAASNLGHILFELSRLELNLGLCIAWFDDGVDVEGQSKKYNSKGLGDKFEAVRKQVEIKRSNESLEANAITAWQRWLDRANQIRDTRNNFVHGRWGTNPVTITVTNVVGLPSSGLQQERQYTLDQLGQIRGEIRDVAAELHMLREKFPL
jgi:hypothetical protein